MDAVEFELYRFMAPDDALGAKFLTDIQVMQEMNRCYSKYVKIEVEATRMSGEMNTSLGNGFSNLMFMLYACHVQGIAAEGIVEGDDGVFALEGGQSLDP